MNRSKTQNKNKSNPGWPTPVDQNNYVMPITNKNTAYISLSFHTNKKVHNYVHSVIIYYKDATTKVSLCTACSSIVFIGLVCQPEQDCQPG